MPRGLSGQAAVELDAGGELDDDDDGGIAVTRVSVMESVMVAETVLVISEGISAGGPIVSAPCLARARHVVVSKVNAKTRRIVST